MAFAKRSTDAADPIFRSLAKPFLFLREHAPGGFHPCERAPGFVVSGLSSQKRAVVGVRTIFGSYVHPIKMARKARVATGSIHEMLVRSGARSDRLSS
jgi:hypothetical protein